MSADAKPDADPDATVAGRASRGGFGRLLMLLLAVGAGLGALQLLRPDLSPFDGRLQMTVTFERTDNLEPGAPVVYGDRTIGKVATIRFDKARDVSTVEIILEPDAKTYARRSSRFRIVGGAFGLTRARLEVKVDDMNAPRLTHGAVVAGEEGLAGKIQKIRKKIEKGAEDIADTIRETEKSVREQLDSDKKGS